MRPPYHRELARVTGLESVTFGVTGGGNARLIRSGFQFSTAWKGSYSVQNGASPPLKKSRSLRESEPLRSAFEAWPSQPVSSAIQFEAGQTGPTTEWNGMLTPFECREHNGMLRKSRQNLSRESH